MFQTLLESRASRARRLWGTSVSIGVHTTAIALAIAATARATAAPRPIDRSEPTDIVWAKPSLPLVHRYAPPTSRLARHSSDIIWSRVTTIDLPPLPRALDVIPEPQPVSFEPGGGRLARGRMGEDSTAVISSGDRIYDLPTVEKAAMPQPGNPAPVYPAALRAAQLEGDVVARFVVDTSGRAEPRSVVFPRASHPAFAEAVRQALLRSRYLPAVVAGHPVRQLVEQRFLFALQR